MIVKNCIQLLSILVIIILQVIALRRLEEKGWKALIPVYKHYIIGKTSEHPVAGIIWGITSFISDIYLAVMTSEVITAIPAGVWSWREITHAAILWMSGYITINLIMIISRYIVFAPLGYNLSQPKSMIALWALVPAIGFAMIGLTQTESQNIHI